MKKSPIYVIINPVSGSESKQNIPEMIAGAFDQRQYDVIIRITGYPEHATEIAHEAINNNVSTVITVGGDGTVNEVARVLVDTDTTLGIIPSGSGNGLARELGIPMDAQKAIEIIHANHTRMIDYGIANGHIFFTTCGVGFDAFVSEKFADEKKRGPFGYVRNVLESVIDFKSEEYELIYDEGTIKERAFIVTCGNASQYGNDAFIAPGADLEDGKMNVSILKPLNALEIPQTTLQLFTKNIDKNSKMITLLTSNLIIKRSHPGIMHVDGEPVSTDREIHVKIVPKGLKVLAPSEVDIKKKENENIFTALTRWLADESSIF